MTEMIGSWLQTLQLVSNGKVWFTGSAQMWRLRTMRYYFTELGMFSLISLVCCLSLSSLPCMKIFVLSKKNCNEVQVYGTDTREEESLWRVVDERWVLRKVDEIMWSLIRTLLVRSFFAWTHYDLRTSKRDKRNR